MLPKSLVVGNCDEDVTVSLLSKIRLECPGAGIIITGGLDHTITFDQASGTLVFRANPRPSESTIQYVVVRVGDQEAYQASLHFLR